MTKEQAEFLKAATESSGNQEIDVRDNYSGRCMYGDTTFAVVVDSQSQLMADVLNYIRDGVDLDGDGNVTVDGNDFPRFNAFRQDSMGRNSVVIY
jgi:hypothetical protein